MRRLTLFATVALFLAIGCRPQVKSGSHAAPVSNTNEIELAVLSDLIAHEDNTGEFVRFVDVDSSDIERLKTVCHNQFQIVSTNSMDESGGFLHLKGSSQAGTHLTVEVKRIDGQNAEAEGDYLRPGVFVGFLYHLRNDGRGWRIISSEFYGAT